MHLGRSEYGILTDLAVNSKQRAAVYELDIMTPYLREELEHKMMLIDPPPPIPARKITLILASNADAVRSCKHDVGSSINSDWFVNSYTMVVYENCFLVQSEFCVQRTTEKLFTDQSELIELPTPCTV